MHEDVGGRRVSESGALIALHKPTIEIVKGAEHIGKYPDSAS